jgi:uncharacterized membrane protein
MKERVLIGLLLAAVVLVYGNTLANQFTLDDALYILQNPPMPPRADSLRRTRSPTYFSRLPSPRWR